jgi:hypothetical protein
LLEDVHEIHVLEAIMKTDITYLMNKYRECVRHLWNSYFLEQLSPEDQWDISDEFDDICTMLFSSLVLNPIGCTSRKKSPGYKQFPEPLPCLHVVPLAESGTPIRINREVGASGYWDYPLDLVKPSSEQS